MARIFITGSSDGLGQLAARRLLEKGHEVILHARNSERATEAIKQVPDAQSILTGDLSSLDETRALAEKVNKKGFFDAIIHNAGVYRASGTEITTVNTLAPYLLTCLIKPPGRLIYLSSGLHAMGQPKLKELETDWQKINYSDSKLHNVILTLAISRLWPQVRANAVDPGWVPTKMGGSSATGNLQKGYETQVWLAESEEERAKVTGKYFFHQQQRPCHEAANLKNIQNRFLEVCANITGDHLPIS